MTVVVRWECEHGYTSVHWQQIEASRATICTPPNFVLEPVEWCPVDNAPARFCDHPADTTTVFRKLRPSGQMPTSPASSKIKR